jgi:hypothetical protein
MDKLIVFTETHSIRHFAYETQHELDAIFLKIFEERVGEWYEDSLTEYFKELIKTKNYAKIKQVMGERKDYEYEGYYLTKIENGTP